MDRIPDPLDGADWALIARYLAGECSAEETAQLEQWLDLDPARRAQIDELRRVWARSVELPEIVEPVDVEAARRRAMARIRANGHAVPGHERALTVSSPTPIHRRRIAWAATIAASLVVAGGAGLLWRASSAPAPRVAAADSTLHEYATPRAQRGVVQLPDGTHLVLAPESRLRLPQRFGVTTRDVYLEGEAYFEVAHDSTRPFLVHAASATARVLGTEFGVRAYPRERAVQVVVKSGRVAVNDAGVLTRGDLARVDGAGRSTVRHDANVDAMLGWTEGRLAFDTAPLSDAVAGVARWYDVDIRLASPRLAAEPFTAAFGSDEPLARVFTVIASVMRVEVIQTGPREYTLRARGAGAGR
jgi:transmembrane sensor